MALELTYNSVASAVDNFIKIYSDSPVIQGLIDLSYWFSSATVAFPKELLPLLKSISMVDDIYVESEDLPQLQLIKKAQKNWGPEVFLLLELVYGENTALIARNMNIEFIEAELVPLEELLDSYLIEPDEEKLYKFIRDFKYFMRHSGDQGNYLLPSAPDLVSTNDKDRGFLEIQQGLILLEEDWEELVVWGLLHDEQWV